MSRYERTVVDGPVMKPEDIPADYLAEPATIEPITTTKTKAYKTYNDAQTSFCGEPVQTDKYGRQYFELADHLKPLVDQHVNVVWPEEV